MSDFIHLRNISELLKVFQSDKNSQHPLIAVVDFGKVKHDIREDAKISADFYGMMFKTYYKNVLKYGRKSIDFQNGSLICMAPNQIIEMDNEVDASGEMLGWGVFFHPDLVRSTTLNDKMRSYTFFSYEVSEALHLSDKEKQILYDCVMKIDSELQENIDSHSQNIIVSNLEVLLNYCSRFYGRQFLTRKSDSHATVAQVEKILSEYFKTGDVGERGLPTVTYLADQVHLSPGYLSDLLKKETGKSAQDHIHFFLIEEAKNVLLGTNKTVGEIAYALGFEYPQYFNKLFRQKTGKTPVEFRKAG